MVYIAMALLVIVVAGLLACLVYLGTEDKERCYDRND